MTAKRTPDERHFIATADCLFLDKPPPGLARTKNCRFLKSMKTLGREPFGPQVKNLEDEEASIQALKALSWKRPCWKRPLTPNSPFCIFNTIDGFVKSPSVPLRAGLRFNFVVAAHL
jgi:hypothetical protein